MKTDNLIDALVADRMSGGQPLRRALLGALALGAVFSLGVFFLELGVRTDIVEALRTWRFDVKVALMFVALLLAFSLCLALSRPVVSGHPGRRLLPLAALAAATVALELAILPSGVWANRMVGSNALICLAAIPILAMAPLAAVLMVLRAGAPASPMLAGAAAGLLAATAGAALYAFHCFDDSPLFVVTWYTLATVPVVLIGAVAGHRLLRW